MTQKMDYQLIWIIQNKASYSEGEVKAAHDELKRRANELTGKDWFGEHFKKHLNSLKRLFGLE